MAAAAAPITPATEVVEVELMAALLPATKCDSPPSIERVLDVYMVVSGLFLPYSLLVGILFIIVLQHSNSI